MCVNEQQAMANRKPSQSWDNLRYFLAVARTGTLSAAAEQNPDLIVIAQSKSGVSPPPVPQGLERAAEINSDDQTFELYRVRR